MNPPRPPLPLPGIDSHFRRLGDRREKPPGHPPGQLVHVGERRADKVTIRAVEYDPTSAKEVATDNPHECIRFADSAEVTWIHVTGLHDTDTLQTLADAFHIHPLIQEDILNTRARPKIEVYDVYIFAAAKLLHLDPASGAIEAQHFSLILLPNQTHARTQPALGLSADLGSLCPHLRPDVGLLRPQTLALTSSQSPSA